MTRLITMPLHEIAHARAGDKGNRLNISVIAYCSSVWPAILAQVTEERVREKFAHRGDVDVKRYVLSNLEALNFVIDNALEGGVNSSLNVDTHGKTNAFLLLDLPMEIEAAAWNEVVAIRSGQLVAEQHAQSGRNPALRVNIP
jgi:hypothetical protein